MILEKVRLEVSRQDSVIPSVSIARERSVRECELAFSTVPQQEKVIHSISWPGKRTSIDNLSGRSAGPIDDVVDRLTSKRSEVTTQAGEL